MAQKDKGKPQRFIRVRGRVVPIYAKQNPQERAASDALKGGAGFVGGAGALEYTRRAGGGLGKAAKRIEEAKPGSATKAAMAFRVRYSKELRAARFKVAPSTNTLYRNSDFVNTSATSPFPGVKPKTVYASALGDEGVFAHELGHAQSVRKKGSMNYLARRSYVKAARDMHKIRRDKLRSRMLIKGKPIQGVGMAKARMVGRRVSSLSGLRTITRLGPELEATARGIGTLTKRYGLLKGVGKSKLMLIGQSTYLASAAATGLLYYGAAKLTRSIFGGKAKHNANHVGCDHG